MFLDIHFTSSGRSTLFSFLLSLRHSIRKPRRAAQSLGLSDTGLAIYGLLHRASPSRVGEHPAEYNGIPFDEPRKELAALIEEAVATQVAIVDWVYKDDVQREARARIRRQLRAASFPPERVDGLANKIVDLPMNLGVAVKDIQTVVHAVDEQSLATVGQRQRGR